MLLVKNDLVGQVGRRRERSSTVGGVCAEDHRKVACRITVVVISFIVVISNVSVGRLSVLLASSNVENFGKPLSRTISKIIENSQGLEQ